MTTCISSREDIKVDLNLKTADALIPESINFTPGQFFFTLFCTPAAAAAKIIPMNFKTKAP